MAEDERQKEGRSPVALESVVRDSSFSEHQEGPLEGYRA